MNINSVVFHQSVPLYSKSNTDQSEKTNTFSSIVDKVGENGHHSNSITKDPSKLYEELSDKYDVRNATFEEIVEISNVLFEAGEISSVEHALITFDFERATNYLKQLTSGVPSNFNMYETSADSNGRRNWIEEFGARASKDFKFGNLAGYQSNFKFLNILERLVR